jgi:hypothetical protein
VTVKPVQAAPSLAKKTSGGLAARGLRIETIKVESEMAPVFAGLRCDGDGNVYIQVSPDGLTGILKFDPKGKRLAVFKPASSNFKVGRGVNFAVAPDGDVYQVILVSDSMVEYVLVYKSDGSIWSEIKLDPGFLFFAGKVVPFLSGSLLVSGTEYAKDHTTWPFQGIFSSSGALLKEVKLEDDDGIHDMGVSGDPKVVTPTNPSGNLAISGGSRNWRRWQCVPDEETLSGDFLCDLARRVGPPVYG